MRHGPDALGRPAHVHAPGSKVPGDDGAGADFRSFADGYVGKHHGVRADHDVRLDHHASTFDGAVPGGYGRVGQSEAEKIVGAGEDSGAGGNTGEIAADAFASAGYGGMRRDVDVVADDQALVLSDE